MNKCNFILWKCDEKSGREQQLHEIEKSVILFFLQVKHTFEHGKCYEMNWMGFHAPFICLMGCVVALNYIKYYKKINYLGHLWPHILQKASTTRF